MPTPKGGQDPKEEKCVWGKNDQGSPMGEGLGLKGAQGRWAVTPEEGCSGERG